MFEIIIVIFFELQIFETKNVHFITTEELPPNTLIGDLEPHISQEMIPTLKLSYLDSKISDYFVLHLTRIKLKRTIDREEICPKQSKNYDCILRLILIYGNTKKPSFITVLITVVDINDNSPRFSHPEIEHVVVENAKVGLSDLYLYEAEDPDRLENGTINYKLRENKNLSPQLFRLQISPENIPKLIQLFPLNYELAKIYLMDLIATDDGNPRKTGTLKIRIKVQDENDNPPIFEKSNYEETIMENILVNEKVVEVVASDSDSEENGKINYHLAPVSNNQQKIASNFFGVKTLLGKGLVYVKLKIDVDVTPRINRFDLMVQACDNGQSQLCSRTTVTIRVIDVNDFRPKISLSYLTSTGQDGESSTISENSINNYIAIVTVTDKDSGPGGIVECQLSNNYFELVQGGNDKDIHNILRINDKNPEQQIFYIKNIKEFDREENQIVKFKMTCKDNPNLQRTDIAAIQLTHEIEIFVLIEDENDNPPEFLQSPYEFKAMENRPRVDEKRIRLGSVEASDKDANSVFHYGLLLNPSQAFELTKSGELFLVRPFDREDTKLNPVRLVVLVSDGKFNQTTSISVFVQDENDLPPVFTLDTYQFNCVENSFSPFLGHVEATDQDTDEFGPIEYKIIPLSPYFSINPRTGMIRITTKLDRETQEFYPLQILAIDNPNDKENRKTGSTTVSVTVLDLNDNYPQILFPPPQKVIVIDANWPIGHKVFTMNAIDPDLKENGTLNYKIIKDGLNLFNIDPKSGNLFFIGKQPITDNQPTISHLVLVASDNGIPFPKSTAVSLEIRLPIENPTEIPDINTDYSHDNNPKIEKSNRKTLIVIVVVALSLIITIIMIIGIIIYQTKIPTNHQSVVKQMDEEQFNIPNQSRNLLTVNGHLQCIPNEDTFPGIAKQYQQSSSLLRSDQVKQEHFDKLHDIGPIDEYQQLMTTPTLLRIWHNDLKQYNELIPSDNLSHFPTTSSASSPLPTKLFTESSREMQKPFSTDQSISSNYLQSSFV